ncbi:Pycsar system effector family protein [Desulforamulus aeronauticus]|uniref:Pycsar effector protein domain-containing protein n=1 Tax=Desulforamulus aeronauticus DSM 10349 TaxID=1121421 RepID=A0A1M6QEZ5_9FIRM|nr:Pycsar system effector family protein [Desulforamulus aeronauticus]SHK18735.1 hypothetical protein SAMN02745123_01005 [Desulforamulus aeronauticus DSM 10349]
MSSDSPGNALSEQVTEKLDKVFTNINYWLVFAEAKNASLLALNGAGIYGLVGLLKNSDYNGGHYLTLYLWMVVVFLSVGLVIPLLSFSPVVNIFNSKKKLLSQNKENLNLLFFGDLVKYDCSKEYVVDFYKHYFDVKILENEVSKIHLDYADEILINSRIAVKKYALFKYALLMDLSAFLSPVIVGLGCLCYKVIKKINHS